MKQAALAMIATGLASTWRYVLEGREHMDRLREEKSPVVYVLWHRYLLPITMQHRGEGISAIVSENRDGELLAAGMRRWGYNPIRGSSSKGGSGAYREALRVLESGGEVAITPDGPRGPAGKINDGALAAARHTGAPVIAIRATASRAWKLNSWDRFEVPAPFARIKIRYSAPLYLKDLEPEAARMRVAEELGPVDGGGP